STGDLAVYRSATHHELDHPGPLMKHGLVEPGNRALWARVAEHGPVRVLEGLCNQGEQRLRELADARLATGDPRTVAEEALRRTHRIGARVVVPEDDEWPHQLDDLARIGAEGGPSIDRDVAPPLCLWVRQEPTGRGAGPVGGGGGGTCRHHLWPTRCSPARLRARRARVDRGLRWCVRSGRKRAPGGTGRWRVDRRG